jgi:hypothetical protein
MFHWLCFLPFHSIFRNFSGIRFMSRKAFAELEQCKRNISITFFFSSAYFILTDLQLQFVKLTIGKASFFTLFKFSHFFIYLFYSCFFTFNSAYNTVIYSAQPWGLSNSQDFPTKLNNFIMKEVELYDIIIHLPISFIKHEL